MIDPAPPLAGLRIIEWGDGLALSYGGWLLAELGAEVVKLEAPDAPPRRPGDHVLARGKRSATLDLRRDLDRAAWARLVSGADALLTDESAPAAASDPDLVHVRVRAWGDAAVDLPRDEALVAALTGAQALQWSWSRRPVWLVTPMIGYMTGILAALGAVAALFARRRGAPGQTVDVSGIGGAFALGSGTYVLGPGHGGSLSQRGDPRGVYPTYGLYPTADGWLFVGALTQAFWVKLMTALERLDLLAHPRLQENPLAFFDPETRAFVRGELEPIFAARSTAAWVARLREGDIPCGAVGSRAEFLRDPEARALGLVIDVDDPVLGRTRQPAGPAVFSATPLPAPRAAPSRGADTMALLAEPPRRRRSPASHGAPRTCLDGIRVLDLTSFIAGPFCPMLLADLGADVVKIETPDGDPFRLQLFGFVGWNRGKRSVVLDLKADAGRAAFLDLARGADVVVDNFRGGVMERLALGDERLVATNERLIHMAISGYGPSGPLATLPGFDPVFQARSGLMYAQGGADAPVLHMIAYNDYCAGALGALATVAALFARERTARGQRVDLSLFRTAFVDQAAHMILHDHPEPSTVGGPDYLGPSAARRLYACRDGWLCVAAPSPAACAALGRLAGVPLGPDDASDGPAARAIETLLSAESRSDALQRLAAADVAAAPCLGFAELFTAPTLAASRCFSDVDDPALGKLRVAGPFLHFSATPITLHRSAPAHGADTRHVLRELGYDDQRLARLARTRGA